MDQFKQIGVIGRLGSPKVLETFNRLKLFLQARGSQVILDQALADHLSEPGLRFATRDQLGVLCDLVIVIGGDGSLLGAARALAAYNVPLLGINRGRLGFLTDVTPIRLEEQLDQVLEGQYIVETRFMLGADLRRDGVQYAQGVALNDVVLHAGLATRMIEFELFIEGQFVYSQRSDGLIISTPTGSTAYALSAGGPIMHPKLDALVLAPMHPHTLSSRPIVVDGNSEVKLVIGSLNDAHPHISCDGQEDIAAAPGDTITIRKRPYRLKLIHPLNHNFYQVCRTKLGWGNRLGE